MTMNNNFYDIAKLSVNVRRPVTNRMFSSKIHVSALLYYKGPSTLN